MLNLYSNSYQNKKSISFRIIQHNLNKGLAFLPETTFTITGIFLLYWFDQLVRLPRPIRLSASLRMTVYDKVHYYIGPFKTGTSITF